jgi:predicted amidohydrolase YtcJ
MKADIIIKNAKIFTADKNQPQATALAVKDGKFVYVGDEAGKDADFLVFDKDLLSEEHEGFSHNLPADVYFGGNKMNTTDI